MDDASACLVELLRSYSPGLLETPRTFELLLRQSKATTPEQTEALLAVVRGGFVGGLRSPHPDPGARVDDCVRALASEGVVSAELAHWACKSLQVALGRLAPADARPAWQRHEPSREAEAPEEGRPTGAAPALTGGMVLQALLIAAGGLLGAALPIAQLALRPSALRVRLQEKFGAPLPEPVRGDYALDLILLAALAAGVGAGLAWLASCSRTWRYTERGVRQAEGAVFAALGALFLARTGTDLGLFALGTLGVGVGAAVGAFAGVWLGYSVRAWVLPFALLLLM